MQNKYDWETQTLKFVTCIFREIWSRFLAFESEVGDLSSILKVEKRRSQAIEKVKYEEVS